MSATMLARPLIHIQTLIIHLLCHLSIHKMNRNSVYMHVICLARAVACIGHNTCLCRPQHLFTSATTPAYVGQCFDLRRPQHLSFTSATTSIYVGQNTCLCRPQHLLTSASAVTCIGHNTSHLCQQRYWPAPAKIQVTTIACVSKNTGLRRPQQ